MTAMKHSARAGMLFAALLAAAPTTGCGPRPERPACGMPPSSAVAVFQPVMPGPQAAAGLDVLNRMFPEARAVTLDRLADGLARCAAEGRVLVIPDAARFPVDAWDPLKAWLDAGHPAVFLGCGPLEARVRMTDGKPEPESALFDRLAGSARSAQGFSSVAVWQHVNNAGDVRGAVRTAQDRSLPWPGVVVEVQGLDLWDAMVLEPVPPGAIAPAENSLALYARGGERTTRLVIECEESDGSRWRHTLALSEDWRLHVIHQVKFAYYSGGAQRGRAGDGLSLGRVRRVFAGLAVGTAPQAAGDHVFGLSDIRLAADPRPTHEAAGWPDLALVCPPYRHADLRVTKVESMESGQRWDLAGSRVQGPLPRPLGLGGEAAAPARWIPLFRATDGGALACAPASLHVEQAADGALRRWGWVGVDPGAANREAVSAMVCECVRRLHQGFFLLQAGLDRYLIEPDAPLRATARCVGSCSNASPVRVVAELLAGEKEKIARRASATCSKPGDALEISLGRAPRAESDARDYVLRLSLEDASVGERVYDRLEQPLILPPEPRAVTDREWMTVTGPRLIQAGRSVFLLGINYWPLTAAGQMPGKANPYWLDPGGYDPALAEQDLERLQEAGINAVAIQYFAERQAPQLRGFVETARRHGIRVLVYLGYLQPFAPDLAKARRLFDAADLRNQPGVFALDLAWEPRFGRAEERRRFDPAWRDWLVEQYGSFEHAERVIGRPLWRRGGRITGPPDAELAADGEHRAAVEVYRRFADDFLSRRYGWIVRELRRWGVRQLVTARTGFGGTGNAWVDPYLPADPAAGAAHLDFLSPVGWGLHGDADRVLEAGFVTAYARGAGGGKPVVWLGFGVSVGAQPRPADLDLQAQVYSHALEMAVRSGAAGGFGWWYPGGWRADEQTDMGVVNPDGSWRPVVQVIRDFAHRLRGGRIATPPWRNREYLRGEDARGLSALRDRWGETYRRELAQGPFEDIRPAGFGRRTGELILRAAGGVPFADPAPIEGVNAEWGRIEIDGREAARKPGEELVVPLQARVRLELLNTGAATWDAAQEGRTGTTWVGLQGPRGGHHQMPLGFTRFGERAVFTWTAADPGAWQVRPFLSSVGGFGERLDIRVAEAPAAAP